MYRYKWIEFYHKELAHSVMEVDKSQDLQSESANWRLGSRCCSSFLKAGRLDSLEKSVFHFKSKSKKKLMSWFEGSCASGILSCSQEGQAFS